MAKTEAPKDVIHWLETRAAFYALLSACFLEKPGPKLKVLGLDYRQSELREAVQLYDPETGRLLEELGQSFRNAKLLSLAAEDFHRLFQPDGTAYLRPYESYYLGQDRSRLRKLSARRAEREVEFFYRHAGLAMDTLYREKADHAGVELAFMKGLTLKEVQARQNDQVLLARCFSQWQRQFLENHLRRWLEELGRHIEFKASTDFYRILARFVWHFVQIDYNFLTNDS
ncbi:MAG: TorD/DmsD family molecular chaperone [Desulfitobacteriaceae bacterium]